MRLNKYLAHCGVGTRKEAETIIKKGHIKVNDAVVIIPHHEVIESDIIKHNDKIVRPKETYYYWLINKALKTPLKAADDHFKPSVGKLLTKHQEASLIPTNNVPEDIYCGLLVMTSDGDLISHLTSDKHRLKSTFQCVLDKPMEEEQRAIIMADIKENYSNTTLIGLGYPEEDDKKVIGLDVLGGTASLWADVFKKNGFTIVKMDCTFYGGLTKKDLKRDWVRKLNEKEIIFLKHFSS